MTKLKKSLALQSPVKIERTMSYLSREVLSFVRMYLVKMRIPICSKMVALALGFVLSSCGPLSGNTDGGDGTPYEGVQNPIQTYEIEVTTVNYLIGVGFENSGSRKTDIFNRQTRAFEAGVAVAETKGETSNTYIGENFELEIEKFSSGQNATNKSLRFSVTADLTVNSSLTNVEINENYLSPEAVIPIGVGATVFNCSGKESLNPFAGGDGSGQHPFLICSISQLQNVAGVNRYKSFKLMSDLSFPDNYNSPEGWIPLGHSAAPFEGSFDGSGRIIDNLQIDKLYNEAGLFGSTVNANIFDLKILNANVVAGGRVGILAGLVINGKITNVVTSGFVKADAIYAVGGLIGRVSHTSGHAYCKTQILNSGSSAVVEGASKNVGGLVGDFNCSSPDALIDQSYALGSVTGTGVGATDCGGLVGLTWGNISRSFASGDVRCESNVGGLVGYAWGSDLTDVYATGNVTATAGSGSALLGALNLSGSITNAYGAGAVIATGYASGLVSNFVGTQLNIINSFTVATVSGANTGGLVSSSSTSNIFVTNSKWVNTGGGATQCVNGQGSTANCTAASSPSEFYGSSGDPINVWDYSTIWESNLGELPTLK